MSSFGRLIGGYFTEKKQWFSHNWVSLLAITILGLLPFLGFFTSGESLFASDQLGSPAWKFYFDSLKHGVIPGWQPYGLGGMPTFDAGYGDGGYPPFLLMGILFPVQIFISYCFILHVLIAGLTAYYFVNRFFNLSRMLSLSLALAYMLNTNFISHIHAGHTGKFYIMAWLPLSLYFLLRSLQAPAKTRYTLGFSLSISWLLLTFHPQFTYFVLMGFFLAWVFKTYLLLKEKQKSFAIEGALRFWGAVMLGIGLVFFMFYPPMQWTKNYGIRGSGDKTTYEHATSWSMHPEETASLIIPEFTGLNERYWGRNPFKLNSEYPGISVWFLGILGLILFRREKEKWFWLWGSVGLLSIIFGLGAHTPLFRLFYNFIPGIKNFRAPSMMLFWLATSLLIMSADTLRRLTRDDKTISNDRRKSWSKKLFQIGFGISALFLIIGFLPDMFYSIWDSLFGGEPFQNLANRVNDHAAFAMGSIRAGVLLGILVFATHKWLFSEVAPVHFGVALLVVTGADLYWVNSNFIKTFNNAPYLAANNGISTLNADTSSYRVFGIPGAYERWVTQYHQIETTDGFTDNEYRLYREFRGEDYQQNPNFMNGLKQNNDGSVSGSHFLDLLNVKYLAYRLQGDGEMHLAHNTSAMPRAWFTPNWQVFSDKEILEKLKDSTFNPKALTFVSDSTSLPQNFSSSGKALNTNADSLTNASTTDASIKLIQKGYNQIDYKIKTDQNGIAVFSELYFPHWHVYLDGKETPLLRANYALRGVAIEPGDHTVVFKYSSPWIKKGFAVAGISFLLLLSSTFGLIILDRRRENK